VREFRLEIQFDIGGRVVERGGDEIGKPTGVSVSKVPVTSSVADRMV